MTNKQIENALMGIQEALMYHARMLEELAVKIDMVVTKINEEE